MVEADCAEHVGNLQRLAHATGAAGHRNAARVEHQKQALAFGELGAEIQVRAEPQWAGRRAVQLEMRNLRLHAFPELLLEMYSVRDPRAKLATGDLRCDARAYDGWNILGTGP